MALVINQCLPCDSNFHVCLSARMRSDKHENCCNPVYLPLSILVFKCFAQASAVLRLPWAESDLFTE